MRKIVKIIKYFSIIMALVFVWAAFDFSFVSANGERKIAVDNKSNVLEINTAADLYKITLSENKNKDFVLTGNIDLDIDKTWQEIVSDYENGWYPISAAQNTGTLDGQGFAIKNLWISRPGLQNMGLFSVCALDIKNLNLELKSTEGEYAIFGGEIAGSLAAVANGTVTNTTAKGEVGAITLAGGLIGQASGALERVSFEGKVSATNAGGLVGNSVSLGINNCFANCAVAGKVVGGLIALADFGGSARVIRNSFAFGTVKNSGESGLTRIGNLIGIKSDEVIIENCYALNDYPLIAQGSSDGVVALAEFEFVTMDRFDLDFDNIWYYAVQSRFPEIRHLKAAVSTNAKGLASADILAKQYFYKGEDIVLNLKFDKLEAKSVLINGIESLDKINHGELTCTADGYTDIRVEFGFLLEFASIIKGQGTVAAEKQFYKSGEVIYFTITPDKDYKSYANYARLNTEDVQISYGSDNRYSFQTGDINESDQFVVYAEFIKIDDNAPTAVWKLVLIITAASIAFLAVAAIIIYIVKRNHKKGVKKHD